MALFVGLACCLVIDCDDWPIGWFDLFDSWLIAVDCRWLPRLIDWLIDCSACVTIMLFFCRVHYYCCCDASYLYCAALCTAATTALLLYARCWRQLWLLFSCVYRSRHLESGSISKSVFFLPLFCIYYRPWQVRSRPLFLAHALAPCSTAVCTAASYMLRTALLLSVLVLLRVC